MTSRHQPIAAPVRRTRHVDRRSRRSARCAAANSRSSQARSGMTRLCGDAHAPRRESQRAGREVGVGLRRGNLADSSLDAHLALQLDPMKEQRRLRAHGELAALAALVVGVEDEALGARRP